jgi:hypothetical protein
MLNAASILQNRHDIAENLLKLVLNLNQSVNQQQKNDAKQ